MRAIVVLLLCACLYGQSNDAQSATAVKTRALDAQGGTTALAHLRDFSATGNITYFSGDSKDSGTVTISYLARGFLRFDAATSAARRSWVLRGPSGTYREDGQKASPLRTTYLTLSTS